MPKGVYERKPKREQQVVGPDNFPVQDQDPGALPVAPLRVHIYPHFPDKERGGIPRVVEGQIRHLPKFGIEITDNPEEADVIAYHATVPSSYIKRFPRKAFVAICHGLYWSEYQWGNAEKKTNADVMEGIRVSDAVIACSEWVANSIRRHTSRYVTVINHGIDYEDWQSNLPHKDYVLWNKTRPDPVCDPEPMHQLAALMPNIKFITTFDSLSSQDKLPNIAITGSLPFDDAKLLVQQAGVYLCTTRETFGIGTLEAMACGVPVVGFNFGGQAEFIEHGVDGWLANPGDIHGLAEGVRWALANRESIGLAAQRKAKQFNWETFAEQYAKIFREIYESKNKSGVRTSIIVTNYQLHEYLEDCLRSIQNQTDKDWECIVVDDASQNDAGRFIAKTFEDEDQRFRLVSNDKNVYLAEARNIGIRMARGRYILPLDADDMLAPDAVAILADALDSNRDIHVAYGNVCFVEEDGRTLTNYGSKFQLGHSSWPFPFVHEQQIQQMNLLPYCSMYRKEAWEQTGGYRRRCRTAEDADIWTRFSSYGFRPRLVTDSDILVYRNRERSMSREQGPSDWIKWFSWTKLPAITPAGACTKEQLPVPSLDPILISVIIPVGPGHEKIVTDAIDSVDTQSFRNWECIVVNDTGKPLPTELPSWVHVIATEGSQGPAAARNAGIRVSRGRAFLPLDADDYLEPDALQFMWDAHREKGDVVYSDFWQSDMSGKKVSIHQCDDYDPHFIMGGRRMFKGQQREGMIHSVTALTPKWAWEKIGGYDENLPAWEDWDFQLALGDIGVCSRRVAAPLFFYRKHTGFRREENYEFFERSKQSILTKWSDLWEGRRQLMACGSCSAANRGTFPPQGSMWQMARAPRISNGEAQLIRYTGEKQGAIPYRGASKTTYFFGKGDVKFVLAEDVPGFLQFREFEIVQPEAPAPNLTEPILVAEGQA